MSGHGKKAGSVTIRIADFKTNCRKTLRPGHPLLAILDKLPDELPSDVLDAKLGDWAILLQAA